jgi:hypothetical protein
MKEMLNEQVHSISVEELDLEMEKLRKCDAVYKESKAKTEELSKARTAQQEKVVMLLKETGRTDYSSGAGKLSYKEEDYYPVISDPIKRNDFLNRLENELGTDFRLVYQTVNSQSLQSLCKDLVLRGLNPLDFGLNEPIKRTKISFRKK